MRITGEHELTKLMENPKFREEWLALEHEFLEEQKLSFSLQMINRLNQHSSQKQLLDDALAENIRFQSTIEELKNLMDLQAEQDYCKICGTTLGDDSVKAQIKALTGKYRTARNKITRLTKSRMGVYSDRNHVLALLCQQVLDSGDGRTWRGKHDLDGREWEAEWMNVIYVELDGVPQMSWHIHDDEMYLFQRVPLREDLKWDKHTTLEKVARINQALKRSIAVC